MALLSVGARMRRSRRFPSSAATWCVVCGWLLLGGLDLPAQTALSPEYQIKAVFLFNFAQFVRWPPSAFSGADAPLVIGVLGDNPFGAYLDDAVRGEKVDNRSLVVEHYHAVDEIKACHILFISRSEATRLEQILARLKDRSVLVVGDGDDFVQRGGTIRLATLQNKIRLIVNVEAAKLANLMISSKLLRSAELVNLSGGQR
jgi:hypothetical protein